MQQTYQGNPVTNGFKIYSKKLLGYTEKRNSETCAFLQIFENFSERSF